MAQTSHEFWGFESVGPSRRGRWRVHPIVDGWLGPISWRCCQGEPLPKDWRPAESPHFLYERDRPEDLLNLRLYVVSDSLRAFIEREAPGAVEFWPVVARGRAPSEPLLTFWAINWLRPIDCLDAQSYDGYFPDGRPSVIMPIIDVTRVPSDALIGPLKHYPVQIIIRDDMMRKLKKERFVGPRFDRLMHTDGRNFKPFIRPEGMIRFDEPPGDRR